MTVRRRRVLGLACAAIVSVAALYGVLGVSTEVWGGDPTAPKAAWPLWRMSLALAYTALGFLCAALLIGPWRVLRGGARPAVHLGLRRDVGLFAGGLALTHMLVGALVHTENNWFWMLWLNRWPVPGDWLPLRTDTFGLANDLGLLQAIGLATVLAISNDMMLRGLGSARWKWLQRLTYLVLASVALHGLLYQRLEDRDLLWRVLFIALIGLTAGMQGLGFWSVWRRVRQSAEARR